MKILFTHRYFWPDSPPYAAMLLKLARNAVGAGHEAHVFAGMPSYRGGDAAEVPRRQRVDGVEVHRCRAVGREKRHLALRVVNVLLYCSALFFAILRIRPAVVTASTFPPVIAGWTASFAAKLVGAHFIYHMQDIHPEVSACMGGRLGRGLPFRLLRRLDNQTLRRAAIIVVPSHDMRATLRARALPAADIRVIDSLPLDGGAAADPPDAGMRKPPGRCRAIFAGNLGLFQNLPALAEGVARLFPRRPDLELCFLGDGAAIAELKARWGTHPQVRFLPFLPFAQAQSLIAEADLGLVSLCQDIYRVSCPSKVQTYLSLGVPVLALVEPESRLARDIEDNHLGAVAASAAPDDIAAAVERVLSRRYDAAALAARVSPARVLSSWTAILAALPPARRGA